MLETGYSEKSSRLVHYTGIVKKLLWVGGWVGGWVDRKVGNGTCN